MLQGLMLQHLMLCNTRAKKNRIWNLVPNPVVSKSKQFNTV